MIRCLFTILIILNFSGLSSAKILSCEYYAYFSEFFVFILDSIIRKVSSKLKLPPNRHCIIYKNKNIYFST